MLATQDLSSLPDPQRADEQRKAILVAKQRTSDVMQQAFSAPDTILMMQRLHVYQTLIIQKSDQLKRLYPDRPDNLWRHQVLIGSSVPAPAQEDFEDFPGEDSVATFVDRLEARYPELVARLEAKLEQIRRDYPDYAQYRWYHMATGGMQSAPNRDFPGADSLEVFIRDLYAEIIPRRPAADAQAAPGDTQP